VNLNRRIVFLLVCIPIVQVVVLPFMPGLNSDVASMGVAAHEVVHGARLGLRGETPYIGNVRIYFIALVSLCGGMNRFSLELPFVIMNPLTILFVYLFMRRLYSAVEGVVCALVLSFCPWFVIREVDNMYYFTAALSLWLFSIQRPFTFVLGGMVLGVGCYEHQLVAAIGLAMLMAWLICGRKDMAGVRGVLLAVVGCVIGFSPRFIYTLLSHTRVYAEPFNAPLKALSDACMFLPYFGGMINGTVIYLRNAGCITYPVMPFNSIIFIGSVCLLIALRRQRLYRALLLFTLFLYLIPFTVIKYTAIRYFLGALFGVALITGLGICELFLRSKKAAVAVLALFCGVNIFYLSANFFIPFARTGGNCLLFRLGNLVEASHHLVRTDILYECLDKDVPVIVCPEPFISRNIQFYDVTYGHFKTITNTIREGYDNFYFIDYARSKLGIRIDPRMFPAYQITLDCPELKNFSVYHFRKKRGGSQ